MVIRGNLPFDFASPCQRRVFRPEANRVTVESYGLRGLCQVCLDSQNPPVTNVHFDPLFKQTQSCICLAGLSRFHIGY
jgi:hypothetical protein